MKNKSSKFIANIFFLILLTAVVFAIVFKNEDKKNLISLLMSVNKNYVLCGIVLALISILGEAFNIRRLLRIFNYDYSIFQTVKYAFVGFFFSGITPSATGGQPMQVYEMRKDGIEISHSSLVLLIDLLSYQLVSFFFGLSALVWFKSLIFHTSKGVFYLIIIGLTINLIGIIFILLSIFNPKMSTAISKVLYFIVDKLPFVRDIKKSKFKTSIATQIKEYNICSKYIVQNKLSLLKTFLTTTVQMFSLFGVSYIVYLALGGTEHSMLDLVFLQSLIYTASSYIPLPGGIGASETSFLLLFKNIYPRGFIHIAMLLTRGICFYLLLLISLVVILSYSFLKYKKSLTSNNLYSKL